MTRDDIIRMAREAGFYVTDRDLLEPQWFRFAALVAAAEREACAKHVADCFGDELVDGHDVAAAIRARGNNGENT